MGTSGAAYRLCLRLKSLHSYVPLLLDLGAWRWVSLQGALLPVPACRPCDCLAHP